MNSNNTLLNLSSPEYHHFTISSLQEITVIFSITKSSKFEVDFIWQTASPGELISKALMATTGQHSARPPGPTALCRAGGRHGPLLLNPLHIQSHVLIPHSAISLQLLHRLQSSDKGQEFHKEKTRMEARKPTTGIITLKHYRHKVGRL